MSKEQILEKVKEIFEDTLDINTEGITVDTEIVAELDVDSLDLVEVVMAAEDTFAVEIPEDIMAKVSTIGDFVNYIAENM